MEVFFGLFLCCWVLSLKKRISTIAWRIDKWCVEKNSGSMKGKEDLRVNMNHELALDVCLYYLKCQRQHKAMCICFCVLAPLVFTCVGGLVINAFVFAGGWVYFPALLHITSHYPSVLKLRLRWQPSERAAGWHKHTQRGSQRGKPEAMGLCDGGEKRAAWGQVKWSQRCWVSSGG